MPKSNSDNFNRKSYYDEEGDRVDFTTSRLDLKTRICLMAAFIYGTAEPMDMTPDLAIEKAVEIENLADARVKRMKVENPIERKKPMRG